MTIHPFDDGDGRIARYRGQGSGALGAGLEAFSLSMWAQIRAERNAYYDILEETQRGSLDVTS